MLFDDQSSPPAAELLAHINHPKLEIVRTSANRGIAKILESACLQCDSEFLAIHGSGDISYPDRLTEQVDYMDTNPNCVAVGCEIENEFVDEVDPAKRIKRYIFTSLDPSRPGIFTHGEVLIRTKSLIACGGYRH